MFKRPDADNNLHVFSEGCPEIGRMLLFRDWLCNHEGDRRLYAEAKRKLTGQTWEHVQNYADAKSTIVAEIMTKVFPDAE